MTLINIRNLGVTLSAPLFSRLNLIVNAGDRIGLVAANGRGKSTLLRCIAGTMEASEGEITRSRGLTVGYVEQNVPEALMDRPLYAAVLETLFIDQRFSERWRVEVALESLEVPEAMRQRPLKQLSGGWQRLPSQYTPRAVGNLAGRGAPGSRCSRPPRSSAVLKCCLTRRASPRTS